MVNPNKESLRENIATKVGNATRGKLVVPSDTVDLSQAGSLYVGTGGDLAVMLLDGESTILTLKNVNDGQELSPVVRRVLVTGTTASDIIVLY